MGGGAETQKNVINKWFYGRLIADMFHLDSLKESNKYETNFTSINRVAINFFWF